MLWRLKDLRGIETGRVRPAVGCSGAWELSCFLQTPLCQDKPCRFFSCRDLTPSISTWVSAIVEPALDRLICNWKAAQVCCSRMKWDTERYTVTEFPISGSHYF